MLLICVLFKGDCEWPCVVVCPYIGAKHFCGSLQGKNDLPDEQVNLSAAKQMDMAEVKDAGLFY